MPTTTPRATGSSSPWGKERRPQRTEGYVPLGFQGLGVGGFFPRAGETLLGLRSFGGERARGERWSGGIYHLLLLDLSRQTSDLQLVREALRSLRNSFSGHDPQHHTIDSLEQGISSLMERLHRMEVQKRQEKRVRGHPSMRIWPSRPSRNP